MNRSVFREREDDIVGTRTAVVACLDHTVRVKALFRYLDWEHFKATHYQMVCVFPFEDGVKGPPAIVCRLGFERIDSFRSSLYIVLVISLLQVAQRDAALAPPGVVYRLGAVFCQL